MTSSDRLKISGGNAAVHQNGLTYFLLIPPMLFMVCFLLAPLANLLMLSFLTHSPTSLWTHDLTLANYLQALDLYYFDIFVRSFRIAAISTAFCVVLGYPIAYYLARCSPRALSIGLFLLVMPLMVSTVIRAFGWLIILGRNGLINNFLNAVGVSPLSIAYTETAVIIAVVQLVLPLMVIPIMGAIENIPIQLEEAGSNLGCGSWGIFREIIVPLSLKGVVAGMVLCFAVAVSLVVTPALLGGRKGRMVGNEIYDQVLTGLNWPLASAMSLLLVLAILIVFAMGGVGSRLFGAGSRA